MENRLFSTIVSQGLNGRNQLRNIMAEMRKQHRWPVAMGIIAVVVIISLTIIYTNRVSSADMISFQAVSNEQGGAIALWQKGHQICAQKIEPSGITSWNRNGILLNSSFIPSIMPRYYQFSIVHDGQGGAIVTWEDRTGSINDPDNPSYFAYLPVYSQRLDVDGETLWEEGVPTGTTQGIGYPLTRPVSDGAGGAIFFYDDFKIAYKALHDDHFYLQRISPEGKSLWGEKGILIYSSPPYHQVTPDEQSLGVKGTWTRDQVTRSGFTVASDSSSGAFLVWAENESGNNNTVYVQHYNAAGKPLWPEQGIPVYTHPFTSIQTVTPDEAGGIFIALGTGKIGSIAEIIIQRVGPEGNLPWSQNGVTVKENPRTWGDIQVIPCGPGSPVVLWQESLGGGPYAQDSLHAVRMNANGEFMWRQDPLLVTEVGHISSGLTACSDKQSVFLTWRLSDNWANSQWKGTIVAQRLGLETGQSFWGESGIAVFDNSGLKYQSEPQVVSDNAEGAIILAVVGKNALQGDSVFAQRLDTGGDPIWNKGIKINP